VLRSEAVGLELMPKVAGMCTVTCAEIMSSRTLAQLVTISLLRLAFQLPVASRTGTALQQAPAHKLLWCMALSCGF
jgi:hypothetical protein